MATVLVTPLEEVKRFIREIFESKGVKKEHAQVLADNLAEADNRGYVTHGLTKIHKYMHDVELNLELPNAFPSIDKESVATALVNGNNGFGAVIGKFCMELAIKKAKEAGIGLVAVYNSNHYGICGIYTEQAINAGLVGLTFSNSSCCSVPSRAKDPVLGTHPFSIGAPGLNGDCLMLDIATTAASFGKIVLAKIKGEKIPEGWALNEKAEITTDPSEAIQAKRLLPIGGTETTGGVKGYGTQLLVEILSGILSGSNYGPKIPFWCGPEKKVANLGQSFIAIDPKKFAPGFEERLSDLMNYLRNMTPACKSKPVEVPGDFERRNKAQVKAQGGIVYLPEQHEICRQLAEKYNVKPIVSVQQPKVGKD